MKTILIDAIQTFVLETGEIYEPLYELLEKFDNPKIIVTNADDDEILEFGLNEMPYPVFTKKHEPNKSDPKFFKDLLEHFELDASDAVYFEHDQVAVDSASSLGIKSYHYDSEVKDMAKLKKFLNENLLEW